MSEPAGGTAPPNTALLKSLSTWLEAGSALVANIAAVFGWVSRYLKLFPLSSEQKTTGIFLSIVISLLGILFVRWRLTVPSKDSSPHGRVRRLFTYGSVALVGLLASAVAFELVDGLWKQVGMAAAEMLVNIVLPLLFGLGHGFLSILLCSLSLIAFAPGLGLFRAHVGES